MFFLAIFLCVMVMFFAMFHLANLFLSYCFESAEIAKLIDLLKISCSSDNIN